MNGRIVEKYGAFREVIQEKMIFPNGHFDSWEYIFAKFIHT